MMRLLKPTALFLVLALVAFESPTNAHAAFLTGKIGQTLQADQKPATATEEPTDDTDSEDGDATGDDSDDTATE